MLGSSTVVLHVFAVTQVSDTDQGCILKLTELNPLVAPMGRSYVVPAECEVDCFTEYQISAKPHTQQSLPATAPVTENLPVDVTCPSVETFGTTKVFA